MTFKMTLNEPLPQGAHFNVRLSPIKADQEIDVSSSGPANKERTEFLLPQSFQMELFQVSGILRLSGCFLQERTGPTMH